MIIDIKKIEMITYTKVTMRYKNGRMDFIGTYVFRIINNTYRTEYDYTSLVDWIEPHCRAYCFLNNIH